MERYKMAFDSVRASTEFKSRMQDMMTDMAKSGCRAATERKKRRPWKWLIPVAAVFIAAAVLMSIPSVSQAVRGWFYDMFRADRYLYMPADEREHNPDLDGALVPVAELEQTNEIQLLPETELYADVAAYRQENGLPAYDPAEWQWLADMKPTITDLYYDGVDFMVMTFFPCDPLPFMSGFIDSSISPMRLDILTFDTATIKNLDTGEVMELYATGHGLVPQKDYWNADRTANVAAMQEDGGVWLYDEYAPPYSEQLEPGRYRIEVTHRILDDHVGEMSTLGTVAVCRQSFVLDTSKALAAIETVTLDPVAFSGDYPSYAVTKWGDEYIEYRPVTVSLDGLSVTPRLETRPTALRVTLDYDKPADWTAGPQGCELTGESGVVYELFVDGVSMGIPFVESDGMECWIDIPMTASERASCRSLILRPVFMNWKSWSMDGVEHPMSEGDPIPQNGCNPMMETLPIENCDIVIPVK